MNCYIEASKACLTRGLQLLMAGTLIISGTAMGESSRDQYTKMDPEALAEHLILERGGFDLDQKTQEGGTVRDRQTQDKLQETCSALKGGQVDSATAKKVTRMAKASMEYPDGGIEMGDWKKGEAIATNAFGFRVGHKYDDHSQKTPGGLCINCHVLDSEGSLPGGSVGPSLENYGKNRGQSEAMQKYTYEVIYNPHSAFPCTKMPRLGANHFLTREQIRHVMAYLLDPDSPVNK